MNPIFLQSLWRSCSTYFWAKFRANSDWRCYNEPLHEILLTLDDTGIRHTQDLTQILRHPKVSEHYFAEYPVQPGGGVPLFQKRFTAENYYLRPGSSDDELRRYFQSLFDHAAHNMQRPFLQPTRGVLRAEWMKDTFGGVHIYLNRNLAALLRSAVSFDGNRSYYLQSFVTIIGQNANDPLFAGIAELKGLAPFAGKTFAEERSHFGKLTADWRRQDFNDIVAFVWLAGLAQASRYADALIEVESLAEEEGRMALRSKILELTGSDIDLADFDSPSAAGTEDVMISGPAQTIIKNAVNALKPDWARLEKLGIGETTKTFLSRLDL